ncbi:MAG: hypothetical protein R6V55_00345 [Desulfovermiculus sp.]
MKGPIVNSFQPDFSLLEVLDARHRVVAAISPSRVHSQGLWHQRAVALIYKGSALLVSRRPSQSPDCPLCWDVSLSEHVFFRCSVYETLREGLYQRLGITFSKMGLTHVLPASEETDNEILTIYSVYASSQLKAPARSECESMFLEEHEIKALVHTFPDQVSSTLRLLYASGLLFG